MDRSVFQRIIIAITACEPAPGNGRTQPQLLLEARFGLQKLTEP